MYRAGEINILSLVPDRTGVGGTKFGYHSFQKQPILDTRDTKNVHIWQDSWRSDRGAITAPSGAIYADTSAITPDGIECIALHGYARFSLSDPLAGPTTEMLGHTVQPSFGGHIWNYSAFVTGASNVVAFASATYPAVFANIGNRCFIARGDMEGVIYDASGATKKVYTIGVGAPTQAPVIAPSDVASYADIYLRKGSYYISNPDESGSLSTATAPGTDTLIVRGDGVTWDAAANKVNIVSKTTAFSTTGYLVSIANGSNIATFSTAPPINSGWVGLRLTVSGETFVIMACGNDPQSGDEPLTAIQAELDHIYNAGKLPDSPSGPGGFDPAYDIINQTFTVTGVRWTMQHAAANVDWPGGVSGDPTIKGELVNTGGAMTWADTPPSYAYAWYDPATGHISNISPIFAPTSTSETDVGVQVNVMEGSGISYPTSTSSVGGTRWTHILFFRTLAAGGSTLYPIGSLDPDSPDWRGLPNGVITSIRVTASATNYYWKDTSRDSDLLVSGALRAPQFTNNKPRIIQNGAETVITPAHMAYWDGRLWVAGPQDPAALHYSCDRVQCPFGIPEESFADTNVLRIPAEDGCVRGMKLIGEHLLVTTERWAYTVAGNNEANYRLVRISTRMAAVGEYQMSEFVSDAEGQGALVVFVGADSRVYAMPLGGAAVWISKEIQTYIDAALLYVRTQYQKVRVHCMSVAGQRLALVYVPGPSGAYGRTYIYDFDTRTWGWHTLQNDNGYAETGGSAAWATVSTPSAVALEVYASNNTDITPPISPNPMSRVRAWFAPVTTTCIPAGYVRTFPLTLDGKKSRKRLHFVRLYVNNQSFTSVNVSTGETLYGWRVTVKKDSDPVGVSVTPSPEYDSAYRLMALGSEPVDSVDAVELIATDAAMTPDAPLIGYTFDVQVTFPNHSNILYQLYKMEIGWSTMSEGQEDI